MRPGHHDDARSGAGRDDSCRRRPLRRPHRLRRRLRAATAGRRPGPAPPTPHDHDVAAAVEQQPQASKPKHQQKPQQQVAGETDTSPAPAAAPVQATEAQTLPFTGFDAGIVALVGVASVAGGIVLRRRVAPDA